MSQSLSHSQDLKKKSLVGSTGSENLYESLWFRALPLGVVSLRLPGLLEMKANGEWNLSRENKEGNKGRASPKTRQKQGIILLKWDKSYCARARKPTTAMLPNGLTSHPSAHSLPAFPPPSWSPAMLLCGTLASKGHSNPAASMKPIKARHQPSAASLLGKP